MMVNSLHAVMVPFPAQGSINPVMSLAYLLSSGGFFITFVNTKWSHNSCMFTTSHGKLQDEADLPSTFRFLTITDGLPPGHGRLVSDLTEYISAVQNLGPVLENHLLCSLSEGIPPITCIVTENFMGFTHQVAINLGVPRIIFWTMCAASSIIQCKANLLLSHGHIPVKVEEVNRPEKLITYLLGNLLPLRLTDLLSFYGAENVSDIMNEMFLYESKMQNKGDYVLVNTFEELEGQEVVNALSTNGCPALVVGPVFLSNFLRGRDMNWWMSLFKDDERCLQWLDTQKPASVVYVAFGNIVLKSNEQLEELAVGLENSQQPFPWVLRMDKDEILPVGFSERTKDRGLVVRWAPQLKALSHPSVGGFLTHHGWNSTLESISIRMGVPMLGWPYFADQFLNCRFTIDAMGFEGVDVDVDATSVVKREVVENGVT